MAVIPIGGTTEPATAQESKANSIITYVTTDTRANRALTVLQVVAILLTIIVSIRVLFFKKS